jgi:integrase
MPDDGSGKLVKYGSAQVHLHQRSDGRTAVWWRENGKIQRTTRKDEASAAAFARSKAKNLDAATGKRWITPMQHERLAWLEKLAGGESGITPLLASIERVQNTLGGLHRLEEAANYFTTHGPADTKRSTVDEAAAIVVEEYRDQSPESMEEIRRELAIFTRDQPNFPLLDLTAEILRPYIRKSTLSKRSIRNKITRWNTFFNRCRTLNLWPKERTNPTAEFKKPRKDDKAPGIFTPEEGRKLLELVVEHKSQYLPYLVVAGWLGVRPSECMRLRKKHFDFKHHLLHLPVEVVGKTARERWMKLDPELSPIIQRVLEGETHGKLTKTGKLFRYNSQDHISAIARKHGLNWIPDILRHSFITYRLQIVENIDKVAEESGNSPAIIRASYRRPIPPGWGKEWFSLLKEIPQEI